MMPTAPNVPSTPHNQKRSEGPLPSLVSTLRSDNRDQLIALLSLDPLSNNLNLLDLENFPQAGAGAGAGAGAATATATATAAVKHKSRLVFASENLRNLIVYHALPDPATRSSTLLKKNARRKGPNTGAGGGGGVGGLTHVEESLGLVPNNPLGIVGTRVIFKKDDDPTTENAAPFSSSLNMTGAMGTETIYNPQNHQSVFGSGLGHMEDPRDDTDGADVIIYFIHPTPEHIQAVSKAVKIMQVSGTNNPFESSSNTSKALKHRIVFLPRINTLSKRILADENIVKRKDVAIHTLDINLIPLEDDVLTCLDMDKTMVDCHVHGLVSEHVTNVAMSLRKIQDICGTIPRMQSFGKLGEMVLERTMALRLDEYNPYDTANEEEEEFAEIAAAIVLDRKVDLVTPLVTPLTYEGLLDDVLKIESGFIKVETDIISPPEDDVDANDPATKPNIKASTDRPKYMHLPLNDLDTLYVEVRDQHVEKFGSFLQEQAKALKESHANFSDKNKDLTEIHQFVKQIPIFTQNLKSLTNHIHLAELIKRTTEQSEFRERWQTERSMVESETCYDTIEDLTASQFPVFRLLRLLCLQSVTSGGIKTNKYESLKREVVQTYGYEYLFVLQNLEKMGLLRKRESMWDVTSPFATLRKQLALIQADVDPLNPDDVSYVSSGYAPISARIIQTSMRGWTGKEDALRELPGRGIDIIQHSPPEDFSAALRAKVGPTLSSWAAQNKGSSAEGKPVLLVYFVGGLTYAEIASLRFMSKRDSFPYRIICCTTKIINGGSFLQSLQ